LPPGEEAAAALARHAPHTHRSIDEGWIDQHHRAAMVVADGFHIVVFGLGGADEQQDPLTGSLLLAAPLIGEAGDAAGQLSAIPASQGRRPRIRE
jgi:hypothetical protein